MIRAILQLIRRYERRSAGSFQRSHICHGRHNKSVFSPLFKKNIVYYMKILVLNCGSSSLKYQLIDVDTQSVLTKGLLERIGLEQGVFSYTSKGEKHVTECPIHNHTDGLRMVMEALVSPEGGVIGSLQEVSAVGHRFAHGGEHLRRDVLRRDLQLPADVMFAQLFQKSFSLVLIVVDIEQQVIVAQSRPYEDLFHSRHGAAFP